MSENVNDEKKEEVVVESRKEEIEKEVEERGLKKYLIEKTKTKYQRKKEIKFKSSHIQNLPYPHIPTKNKK